jgi:Prp8 binding protein
VYRLPGHSGCVNDVAFHPTEPIVASASNDKTIFLGEIEE